MNIKEVFLTNLQEMIKDRGLSFRAFSAEIGINRRTMNRWSFDRSPSIESVVKIANYFNCSIDFLLERSDCPEINVSKNPSTFYERYTLLKERNRLSDRQIAKICTIAPSTVSNWKNGATPNFEITVKLCDIFYCSFDYLVGRSDT